MHSGTGIGKAGIVERETPPVIATYTLFGTSCGSGPPALSASAPPIQAQPFAVDITNLTMHQSGVLLMGASDATWNGIALPVELGQINMPGCWLYVSGEVQIPFTSAFATSWTWSLTLPPFVELLGQAFYNQAFLIEPAANGLGLVSTNAGKGIVGF